MSNTILTKRIGTTTYKVNVHFNQNATETMEEKFMRVISNYPLANGEKCGRKFGLLSNQGISGSISLEA